MAVVWNHVTRDDVLRAIQEYDRLGPKAFFSAHGFGPTTTYDLVWDERRYPPKAILGTAYEFSTGQRLAPGQPQRGRDPLSLVTVVSAISVARAQRADRLVDGGRVAQRRAVAHRTAVERA